MIFDFVLTTIILIVFIFLSKPLKLLDIPTSRKRHFNVVPIIGGVSIFTSFMISFFLQNGDVKNNSLFFLLGGVLLIVGVLDDRFDINYKIRILVEMFVVLIMMFVCHLKLQHLGNIFGFGNITLPLIFYFIVTMLGVIGAINAFNMIDGIDGLLGSITLVTLFSLSYLFNQSSEPLLSHFCLMLAISVIPFLIFNLGLLGAKFKIFMGDAGSIFIGFTVIWLILQGTQVSHHITFQPVTALWLMAIPLLDMVSVMLRRIRKGKSPFFADRTHLHHICQRIGLSKTQSLILIVFLAIVFALIGVFGEVEHISSYWMFYSFILLFVVYNELLKRIWRITAYFRRRRMLLAHSH